jgi:microcystin-dependent protein
MAAGDQSGTWGDTTNTNLGTLIEESIAGVASVVMATDTDYTLTANNGSTDEARQMILSVTSGVSLTATRNVIVPSKEKLYVVYNNTSGSQSILVKTSGGTGITIPNGKVSIVFCDATNVNYALTHTTLPATDITGALAVTNGGTGLTSAGSSNQVLTTDGSSFSLAQLTSSNLTTATANALTPAGTIIHFGGTSAPSGYLACDGTAVSRTTYSDLFSAIGTTWGTGDGSTTFNIPNLQGTFLRGAGTQTYTNAYDGGSVGDKSRDKITIHSHEYRSEPTYGSATPIGTDDYALMGTNASFPDASSRICFVAAARKQTVGGITEQHLWIGDPQRARPGQSTPNPVIEKADETVPFNATILYCIKT